MVITDRESFHAHGWAGRAADRRLSGSATAGQATCGMRSRHETVRDHEFNELNAHRALYAEIERNSDGRLTHG